MKQAAAASGLWGLLDGRRLFSDATEAGDSKASRSGRKTRSAAAREPLGEAVDFVQV